MRDVTVPDSHRPNQGDVVEMCSAWGCNMVWDKSISGIIPLCRYHFAMAHAAWANCVDEGERVAAERRVVATSERKHMQKVRLAHVREGGPVVYYVSMPPHIKIGTSTNFRRRMREFYVQHDDLLAVEPGGRSLEASRHQQFASFRVPGTELFKQNSVLDDLVAELAAKSPDAWLAGDEIHDPTPRYEETNRELHEARLKLGLVPENVRAVDSFSWLNATSV
jgi:hypothetical protein